VKPLLDPCTHNKKTEATLKSSQSHNPEIQTYLSTCYGGTVLPNNTIEWCFRQRKGIRLIDPNENLAKAYIKKAKPSTQTKNLINNTIHTLNQEAIKN